MPLQWISTEPRSKEDGDISSIQIAHFLVFSVLRRHEQLWLHSLAILYALPRCLYHAQRLYRVPSYSAYLLHIPVQIDSTR